MSTDSALVVIDVQVGLIEPSYRSTEVLEHISTLLEKAHNSRSPVIYVQHDGSQGHGLEVGTAAWEIHGDRAKRGRCCYFLKKGYLPHRVPEG